MPYSGSHEKKKKPLHRYHRKNPEIQFDICTVLYFHYSHYQELLCRGTGVLKSTFVKKTFAALQSQSWHFTWKLNVGIYSRAESPRVKEVMELTQTLGAKIPWFAATFQLLQEIKERKEQKLVHETMQLLVFLQGKTDQYLLIISLESPKLFI